MELTGNPFVDIGLGIAARRTGRESIQALTGDDLRKVVATLHRTAAKLKNLNILASFWVNNPFMGKNLQQKPKFESFLNSLETNTLPTRSAHCQVCGRLRV
jgi:hypothetical protein